MSALKRFLLLALLCFVLASCMPATNAKRYTAMGPIKEPRTLLVVYTLSQAMPGSDNHVTSDSLDNMLAWRLGQCGLYATSLSRTFAYGNEDPQTTIEFLRSRGIAEDAVLLINETSKKMLKNSRSADTYSTTYQLRLLERARNLVVWQAEMELDSWRSQMLISSPGSKAQLKARILARDIIAYLAQDGILSRCPPAALS